MKNRITKLWKLGNESLRALQLFMASYLSRFHNVIIIDKSYLNATFNNRRLAGQNGGGLMIGKVQTQLYKDEWGSKNQEENKNKQKIKDR